MVALNDFSPDLLLFLNASYFAVVTPPQDRNINYDVNVTIVLLQIVSPFITLNSLVDAVCDHFVELLRISEITELHSNNIKSSLVPSRDFQFSASTPVFGEFFAVIHLIPVGCPDQPLPWPSTNNIVVSLL